MRAFLPAVAATVLGVAVLAPTVAAADQADVPGTVSTTSVNTSRLDLPIPAGVRPKAITGILVMPEVVSGGVVTFRVNGRVAEQVPSTLYTRVRIPVTQADVIANGTIGLTVESQGPAIQDLCRPAAGAATLRNVQLDYNGTETPPTSLADFFPASSAGITVLIPNKSDDDMYEAGIAAVAALASRYPEGTDISLAPVSAAKTLKERATRRIVLLAEGRPGDITTTVAVAPNTKIPFLTISATGDDLAAAARALALPQGGDTLQLADDPEAEGLTGQIGQRDPDLELSLADIGATDLSLSGYGTTSRILELPQDAFSSPVKSLDVHLQGAHSAVADSDRARFDVRLNGALVGSQSLDATGDLQMDFTVPAGRLRSVNTLELVLSAVTPDGLPCAAPGSPPVEVDLDAKGSTLTATAGRADTRGFQLFPQVLQSSLPVAVRAEGAPRFAAVQDAARVVATLQHAAAYPLDVQLVPAEAFIADDRSGLLIGATTNDATSLDAPLKLSSIRLLDQPSSSFQVTSQEPYAVLESIDGKDRQVLMLGSWAPGNEAAPAALSTKVVDHLEEKGWATLDGDLLLTDESSAPFTVDSRSLKQEETATDEDEEDRSYAKWFIALIALLLLMIGFQAVVSIRRDRRVAHADDTGDDESAGQPAYLEDLEFREQHLPPDEPSPPAKKAPPKKAPTKKAAPTKKGTSPAPPTVTKRSRNQKKKR